MWLTTFWTTEKYSRERRNKKIINASKCLVLFSLISLWIWKDKNYFSISNISQNLLRMYNISGLILRHLNVYKITFLKITQWGSYIFKEIIL